MELLRKPEETKIKNTKKPQATEKPPDKKGKKFKPEISEEALKEK